MKNRFCRKCGIGIPEGTSAKRAFCCNSCRNDYNLERRKERDKEILEYINGILKNYQVLRIWEEHSELTVTLVQLIDNGFLINYFPETRTDKIGIYYGFGHFRLYPIDDIFSNFFIRNTKLS